MNISKLLALPVTGDVLGNAIIQAPGTGVFAEFGVASGATLRRLAKERYTIGFDTFDGLPEQWRHLPEGTFHTPVIPMVPNTSLLIGLFENTVPRVDASCALCHIDCDLYKSAKEALAWFKRCAAPGAVVVFDEFYGFLDAEQHEQKALEEAGLPPYEWILRGSEASEKAALRLL